MMHTFIFVTHWFSLAISSISIVCTKYCQANTKTNIQRFEYFWKRRLRAFHAIQNVMLNPNLFIGNHDFCHGQIELMKYCLPAVSIGNYAVVSRPHFPKYFLVLWTQSELRYFTGSTNFDM